MCILCSLSHVRVNMHVWGSYVYLCMWSPEVGIRCLPQSLPSLFCEARSLMTPSRLARELQTSACFSLPAPALRFVLGSKPRSSGLHGKHLTNWATSLASVPFLLDTTSGDWNEAATFTSGLINGLSNQFYSLISIMRLQTSLTKLWSVFL